MADFSTTHEAIDFLRVANGDIAEPRDINDALSLQQRRISDLFGACFGAPWAPGVSGLASCRPIGNALKPSHSTADVRVDPGLFWFAPSTDPGQPAPHGIAHSLTSQVTIGTAASNPSGSDRRDLLTVKVTRLHTNPADQETRRGRLASGKVVTVTPIKRWRTLATFHYHEGTPAARADHTLICNTTVEEGTQYTLRWKATVNAVPSTIHTVRIKTQQLP